MCSTHIFCRLRLKFILAFVQIIIKRFVWIIYTYIYIKTIFKFIAIINISGYIFAVPLPFYSCTIHVTLVQTDQNKLKKVFLLKIVFKTLNNLPLKSYRFWCTAGIIPSDIDYCWSTRRNNLHWQNVCAYINIFSYKYL